MKDKLTIKLWLLLEEAHLNSDEWGSFCHFCEEYVDTCRGSQPIERHKPDCRYLATMKLMEE